MERREKGENRWAMERREKRENRIAVERRDLLCDDLTWELIGVDTDLTGSQPVT